MGDAQAHPFASNGRRTGRGFETTRVKGCLLGQSALPARPAPHIFYDASGGKITLPVVAADRSAMLRCTTYGMDCAELQDYCLSFLSRSARAPRLARKRSEENLSKGRSFFKIIVAPAKAGAAGIRTQPCLMPTAAPAFAGATQ